MFSMALSPTHDVPVPIDADIFSVILIALRQLGVCFPVSSVNQVWLDMQALFQSIIPAFVNHDSTNMCQIIREQKG